jgi:hypothetical protein
MRHGSTRPSARAVVCWFAVNFAPALAFADSYYLSEQRLGMRTAPLLLLSRSDVRAALQLSPEQSEKALGAIEELYKKAESLRGKKDDPAVVEERRALDSAQEEWLRANLTAAQFARLDEIDLQWEGPSALISRPTVTARLGLSSEQRTALTRAVQGRNRLRAGGNVRLEDERRLAQQALGILTVEQKSRWNQMLGKHFEVQWAGSNGAVRR